MRKTSMMPLFLAILLAMPACATAGGSGGRSSFGDITAAEIEEADPTDTYDVIRRLRPSWLRSRGVASLSRPAPVVVYMDNMRIGGLGELRSMSPAAIERITFLDSHTATQRYGTGHVNGAIAIFTH